MTKEISKQMIWSSTDVLKMEANDLISHLAIRIGSL
jgi:hypothetical protein